MKSIVCLLVTFSLFSAAIPGCRDTDFNAGIAESAIVQLLFSKSNYTGGNRQVKLLWITNEKDFEQFCGRFPKNVVNSEDCGKYEVNYKGEAVLIIDMGQKPTAGYAIGLAKKEVTIIDGVAIVQVEWVEPASNAFLAQVVTHPCMALKLPKAGFKKIRVVDQSGNRIEEVEIP